MSTAPTKREVNDTQEFVWLLAVPGVGKTFTGDYLEEYHDYLHVDGDWPVLSPDASIKKMVADMVPVYYNYWCKRLDSGRDHRDKWQPVYELVVGSMVQAAASMALQSADANTARRTIVVSNAAPAGEIRHFVRKRIAEAAAANEFGTVHAG